MPYLSRMCFNSQGPHLFSSVPVLVSQPLVWSFGRQVLKELLQKQVLLVWHTPSRLQDSALAAAPQALQRTWAFPRSAARRGSVCIKQPKGAVEGFLQCFAASVIELGTRL